MKQSPVAVGLASVAGISVILAMVAYIGWAREPRTFRLSAPLQAGLNDIRLMSNGIGGAPPEAFFAMGKPYEAGSFELSQGKTYLVCRWQEQGGPPVQPPGRRGYGTEMIEGTAAHLGGRVELSYDVAGLAATIRIPV